MPASSPVESVFFAALDRPPAERAAFLDTACRGDTELRARVEKMLAAQPDLGDFLGRPAVTPVSNPEFLREAAPRPLAGVVVAGKYELRELIGEGGMGAVWAAEQRHPVERTVAVKLIRGEGGSRGVLARFEAERHAIARMDHPHIAKLLDAGTTESGSPFFVMELVHGLPLNAYCDRHRLTVPDRLRLFVQICRAVQHAHQKGIIHRDLKPSNILVEHHDGRPVPRVIDFGLAKATGGARLPGETLFTGTGNITGTPLYMAPEQADAATADVDTRADVYALGANLYELLTGTTPIERERLKTLPLLQLLGVIRDTDPPPPSARLAQIRNADPTAARAAVPSLRELDWVVMKALAKEPDRRYESAAAFAADVERFLNHEPVAAGPPGTAYRLRKFVRRNRGAVVASGLVLVALLAGIAGTTFGLVRAENRRKEAESAQRHEAAQRTRAEKARDRTWAALEAMTSWLTGQSLAKQKELTPEQKDFLAEVLVSYREFAAEQTDDEPSRVRTADAADRVGAIEQRLGRYPQAVAAARVARDAFARLAADFPEKPGYRHRLAAAHNASGTRLTAVGDLTGAEENVRAALSIWTDLAAEFRDSPEYRSKAAAAHNNLGVVLVGKGQRPAAMDECLKAIAIQEKVAAEFPADPRHRRELAYSHSNVSGLLKIERNPTAAAEHILLAVALHKQLVKDHPDVPDHRAELAGNRGNLGLLLGSLGNPADAAAEFREALATLKELADEFPGVPEYRVGRATRHADLGRVLTRLHDPAGAEKEFRRAMTLWEPLADEFARIPAYRHHLADTYTDLGKILRAKQVPEDKEAEALVRKAIALRRDLVREVPADHELLDQLGGDHDALSRLLMKRGERKEGEEQFRLAVTTREKLVAVAPEMTVYQTRLGGVASNFGRYLFNAGRLEESLTPLDLAVRTLTATRERDRTSVIDRDYLSNSLSNRAFVYHRLKRHTDALKDWNRVLGLGGQGGNPSAQVWRAAALVHAEPVAEAVAAADELAKSPNLNPGLHCMLAGVYAQASARTPTKQEEYAARALELIRLAAKPGTLDPAWYAKDEDLAPLRGRDDFKKLLAELQKK